MIDRPAASCQNPNHWHSGWPNVSEYAGLKTLIIDSRNARRTSTSLQKTKRTMRSVLGVRRPRRSTSDARQVSNEEKDQRQTPTRRTGPKTKDRGQLRRFGPCWLRRTNVKLRSASIPSWAKPVQQGSRTQISKVGNLEKPTTHPLLPRRKPGVKSFATQPAKSFSLVTENFNESSLKTPALVSPAYLRQRPNVTLFRSSAFSRSLRVSERAPLRQVI